MHPERVFIYEMFIDLIWHEDYTFYSCWIHRAREMFDSDEGKAMLKEWGIPETYRGVGHCALGYAAAPAPAYKPRREDAILRL